MALPGVKAHLYSASMKLSDVSLNKYRTAEILLIWILAACLVSNVWLSISEPLTIIQALANVILPAGVYLILMTLSRHIGRTGLWMITAMFFSAFQLVLLYMYGRSVIAVDMFLNVVTTNPEEVGELLGNMAPIIIAIIGIYVTPIVASIVAVVKKWRLSERSQRCGRLSGYILTGAGLLLLSLSFTGGYTPLKHLFPVNALYNVVLAVDRTSRLADYPETSATYTFNASSERPDSLPEVFVAVIGETSRADNWQILGYRRPTTPALMNMPGVIAFPRALSQSNTTHKSVPMLLSALDASNFADSLYSSKSLITAFREAGFATAFISNQNRNHSFIDRFGLEADTCIFIGDDSPSITRRYDTDLLGYLDRSLAGNHTKLLIVLHCYGSHFSYYDRYPRKNARFTPDGPCGAEASRRNELINAYDNTIVETSSLLASIAKRLDATGTPAAMIYASDHGEDIFDDDRRLFLHASPCPSYWQIHVPMIVWMSDSYRTAFPGIFEAAKSNSRKFVASSQAYFHTLMQLAGISTPRFNQRESVASKNYTPSSPRYLNDHNECVDLTEAGFLEPDFHKLDSIAIPR